MSIRVESTDPHSISEERTTVDWARRIDQQRRDGTVGRANSLDQCSDDRRLPGSGASGDAENASGVLRLIHSGSPAV